MLNMPEYFKLKLLPGVLLNINLKLKSLLQFFTCVAWTYLIIFRDLTLPKEVHWLRFVYIRTKTRHFCVSIGHFICNEKFFRFIKLVRLTRKRRVSIVVYMNLKMSWWTPWLFVCSFAFLFLIFLHFWVTFDSGKAHRHSYPMSVGSRRCVLDFLLLLCNKILVFKTEKI